MRSCRRRRRPSCWSSTKRRARPPCLQRRSPTLEAPLQKKVLAAAAVAALVAAALVAVADNGIVIGAGEARTSLAAVDLDREVVVVVEASRTEATSEEVRELPLKPVGTKRLVCT